MCLQTPPSTHPVAGRPPKPRTPPTARKRHRADVEAKLSCNFRKWLRDLDENALMSVLFKAVKWYAPQVVQGREASRDALVLAYQQRCGGGGGYCVCVYVCVYFGVVECYSDVRISLPSPPHTPFPQTPPKHPLRSPPTALGHGVTLTLPFSQCSLRQNPHQNCGVHLATLSIWMRWKTLSSLLRCWIRIFKNKYRRFGKLVGVVGGRCGG